MLVPKSLDPVARGRKMPVPDERPSEKIAKLFPQTDPLKDPPRETEDRPKPPEAPVPPQAARATRAFADPAIQAAIAKPVPLPEARPRIEPVSAKPHRRHLRRYRPVDETPVVELDPRIAGAAAAQARPQRRGARAVGKRRQAGQAAAQAAPCCEAAGRFGRGGNQCRAETGCFAKAARPPRIAAPPKPEPPPLAPLGRRERSQLSRGRKEIDARLDLHGMTQTRAHRVLFSFLQRAHMTA